MVLLGVDIGGTSIRAVACSPDGALLGRGTSRGGNPRSSAGEVAGNIAAAVRAALSGAAEALARGGAAEPRDETPGATPQETPGDASATAAEVAVGSAGAAPDRSPRIEGVCLGAAGAGPARRGAAEDLVRRALRDAADALAATVAAPLADPLAAPVADSRAGRLAGALAGSLTEALAAAPAGPLDGVAGRPLLVTDLDIAFRSAAPSPDGALLLVGTGAVAASYAGWRQLGRRDGLGWLLGDTGSGVWIGRRVLRAVAAELDRNGPPTTMTPSVLAMLSLVSADRSASAAYPPAPSGPAASRALDLDVDPQDLIRAVDVLRPAEWARFAGPALYAPASDAVAAQIVDQAAAGLLATLAAARGADGAPVVLAGGLLASGPLRRRIDAAHPGAAYAPFPVVGACAAAAELAGAELDRAALTDALL